MTCDIEAKVSVKVRTSVMQSLILNASGLKAPYRVYDMLLDRVVVLLSLRNALSPLALLWLLSPFITH